jgi:hypothetical protein
LILEPPPSWQLGNITKPRVYHPNIKLTSKL